MSLPSKLKMPEILFIRSFRFGKLNEISFTCTVPSNIGFVKVPPMLKFKLLNSPEIVSAIGLNGVLEVIKESKW